jgi:hypothetical protein
MESLRQNGKLVEAAKTTEALLGNRKAVHYILTYKCTDGTSEYIRDSTIALTPDKRFIFEVTLETPTTRYKADEAVLNSVRASWKFNDPKQRH